MPGGQLTNNADLALREALDVQLQCIGQSLPAASLCEFATSRLPPVMRVYTFTIPEASRYSHNLPGTTACSFCFRDSPRGSLMT